MKSKLIVLLFQSLERLIEKLVTEAAGLVEGESLRTNGTNKTRGTMALCKKWVPKQRKLDSPQGQQEVPVGQLHWR